MKRFFEFMSRHEKLIIILVGILCICGVLLIVFKPIGDIPTTNQTAGQPPPTVYITQPPELVLTCLYTSNISADGFNLEFPTERHYNHLYMTWVVFPSHIFVIEDSKDGVKKYYALFARPLLPYEIPGELYMSTIPAPNSTKPNFNLTCYPSDGILPISITIP